MNNFPQIANPTLKGGILMPLENNNLLNDNDPETRLENDKSKDLKLIDEMNLIEDTATNEKHGSKR
jgi:hypothetical protein